jgi:hypothetical protein
MGKTDPPPRKRQKAGEDKEQAQQEVRRAWRGGRAVPDSTVRRRNALMRYMSLYLLAWSDSMICALQDTDTSQMAAAEEAAAAAGATPTGRKAPRGARAAAEQPAAAGDPAGQQQPQQRARKASRRQGGGGTTSAAAAAADQGGEAAPKAAAAFQPRDRRFTADSDTIMEAVVKVRLTLTV